MKQHCKLYLVTDHGEKIFGRGPVELLEQVDQLGSLHRAAKQMYLSYSKAVKLIRTAEEGFGFPLLITETGGTGGGGSVLTEDARRVIAQFRAYETAIHVVAEQQFQMYFSMETPQGEVSSDLSC